MTIWHYRHSGFTVASELHLPEWASFALPHGCPAADITIRWRTGLSETPYLQQHSKQPTITRESCEFFVPEAGFYQVSRDGTIAITAAPDPDRSKVRVFLLGTAWSALCSLQGLLVIHASLVAVGGAAIAFCGESGAGKSSLAARMTTLDYSLISDDLCRVDLTDPGPPRVYRSARRLKLWRDALEALAFEDLDREQDHVRMEKFHVPLAGGAEQGEYPLAEIFLLTWGDPGLTRLTGLDALQRLIGAATYRGEMLEPMGQLAGHWTRCAELVKRVRVWELARPRDWSRMDETVALVLAAHKHGGSKGQQISTQKAAGTEG